MRMEKWETKVKAKNSTEACMRACVYVHVYVCTCMCERGCVYVCGEQWEWCKVVRAATVAVHQQVQQGSITVITVIQY